ncbi:DUF4396 domain-containing protein [Nocardia sp. NBC_00565]|uniref:DUF4396 domain-containing protein n=1 Tax=Nocardia sp. NBC_00565 TaxID=2975993 RepID=UPI002E81539C|nr:DUF4396 domain-containing protein [Nocardia sp. NBC_00565]WUC03021.1 DUF4396 domain-containing protein [Nocardia sp. NBC_00565]
MEHAHGKPRDHHEHAGHAGHSAQLTDTAHTARANIGQHAPASWRMAAQATLHCLTGCAIGEILGMVIGTALGWNNTATMVLAIVLAFFFGYLLTMRGVLKAGLPLAAAVTTALAADTVSITVMEIVDNAVILAVPGAMDAHLDTVMFWATLAFSLVVAFVLTTPVNKWMIGRGKGHAVVHSLHAHH